MVLPPETVPGTVIMPSQTLVPPETETPPAAALRDGAVTTRLLEKDEALNTIRLLLPEESEHS
jgi:hypothetical protein